MKYRKLKLKTLLVGLALLTFLFTMLSSLWGGYGVEKERLIETTLETNAVYSQKLATTADMYLEESLQLLDYSANYLPAIFSDDEALFQEVERLRLQSDWFNSVVILNKDGLVLSVSPSSIELKGQTVKTKASQKALAARSPYISEPYESITGQLVIFFSQPVYAEDGSYLGLVGGTLYLKEDNALYRLLGEHFYQDGSYVYVVDGEGQIIYHQNRQRIGDFAVKNKVVQKLMAGKSGAELVTNTENIQMLAGYHAVTASNWGVVAQQPLEQAMIPTFAIIKRVALSALPFLLLSLIISIWTATHIARPLQNLALLTEVTVEKNDVQSIKKVHTWYYEAHKLKRALVTSFTALQQQVTHYHLQSIIDPLTGLTNRRTMDDRISTWVQEETSFSLILLDLDHFKSVNDTYGHHVGDEVLIYLAEMMLKHARPEDSCCRFGGEEFVLLLPHTPIEEALVVAENLRKELEETVSPCGRPVTMSAGVGHYPQTSDHPAQLFELIDAALYEAKQQGRNQIHLAIPTELSK